MKKDKGQPPWGIEVVREREWVPVEKKKKTVDVQRGRVKKRGCEKKNPWCS